ncbi:signal peptidase I [Archaeoglobus veneficus]|uniref:Peptidase S26B, signal peptidase n=1 Tax=Archaeoglobus veneficus (strain DSM 11195 / SNP6) TaxID=693661 RepID=F2KNV0_ARCVS|nr:signal peptidase I [Archaeoglobus veneficus]AEA47427.1 peptidase S26B, signal peptidase [Archaeoglobus veneficus SNP6]
MRTIVEFIIISGIVMLSAVSIVGALFDRPVLLSYVTSDSMEPTINRYDLFFINPFSHQYSKGDIIVFKSEGKWVCHRVYAVVDDGYITKGDNNVATDQSGGKNIVRSENIAGKVITIFGKLILIPGVGTYTGSISSLVWKNKLLFLVIFSLAGLFSLTGGKGRRQRNRRYIKLRHSQLYTIMCFSVLIIVSLLSVALITPHNISYGTTSAAGVRPEWVSPGDVFEREIEIKNHGIYPYYFYVKSESPRAEVEEGFFLMPGDGAVVSVVIHAPDDTGIYSEKVLVCKYLPLAPLAVFDALAAVSVYLPIMFVNFEIGILMLILYPLAESSEVYKVRNPLTRRV